MPPVQSALRMLRVALLELHRVDRSAIPTQRHRSPAGKGQEDLSESTLPALATLTPRARSLGFPPLMKTTTARSAALSGQTAATSATSMQQDRSTETQLAASMSVA